METANEKINILLLLQRIIIGFAMVIFVAVITFIHAGMNFKQILKGEFNFKNSIGEISIYNTETGKLYQTIHTERDVIISSAISPNGKYIAGSSETSTYLYEIETGKLLWKVPLHRSKYVILFFSTDSAQLFEYSYDRIATRDTLDGKIKRDVNIKPSKAWSISSDMKYFAVINYGNPSKITIYTTEDWREYHSFIPSDCIPMDLAFKKDSPYLTIMAIVPRYGEAAYGIYKYDIKKKENYASQVLEYPKLRASLPGVSSGGKYAFAKGDMPPSIIFWDSDTGLIANKAEIFDTKKYSEREFEYLNDIVFTPNGSKVAAINLLFVKNNSTLVLDKTVCYWNTSNWKGQTITLRYIPTSAAFSPNGKFLAVAINADGIGYLEQKFKESEKDDSE